MNDANVKSLEFKLNDPLSLEKREQSSRLTIVKKIPLKNFTMNVGAECLPIRIFLNNPLEYLDKMLQFWLILDLALL